MATEKMIEAICRSPTIEAITPTTEQWERCETIQDRYDLMKRLVRAALSAQVQDVTPVGQVDASYGNEGMLVACFTPNTLPVGTKLFTAPPAQSVAIPDGWQLIPKEPTREMWAAMANTLYGYKNRHHDKVAGDLFQAMLAAAPAAKLEEKP